MFLYSKIFIHPMVSNFVGNDPTLGREDILRSDHYLISRNGKYVLWMQNDANLVLYKCLNEQCSGPSGKRHIWASNTYGRGKSPYRLVMQSDNALVIYDANSSPIWWNNALIDKSGLVDYQWREGAYATLQDDGNFVVYDGQHRTMWDTGTYDGNKGIYGVGRKHQINHF